MVPEPHSYRRTWALSLATARAVLALACLIFQLFLAPVDFAWFTLAIVLFSASTLFAVRRSERLEGTFGLLTLFIDAVFFMVLARYGAKETLWLAYFVAHRSWSAAHNPAITLCAGLEAGTNCSLDGVAKHLVRCRG